SRRRAVAVVVAHLDLHCPWVPAFSPLRQDEVADVGTELEDALGEPTCTLQTPGSECGLDERESRDEADARRGNARFSGDSFGFESYKVVGEGQPPEFLGNAARTLAAGSLFAFEHDGLHFAVAEFDLPSLVVELHDLGSGILPRVDERGKKCLGREA